MLKLVNVVKTYVMGDSKVEALKGISVNFRKNEFVSILGPSGCGKTTLLNIIGGLDKYTVGDLVINGVSTKQFTDRDWDVYRNHRIGFIFQSYNLIPHQTILENVELASQICKNPKDSEETLKSVGLGDRINHFPAQLSGGEQQRVSIARALAKNPKLLLCDEPTGALDSKTGKLILELLQKTCHDSGMTTIIITHNAIIADIADKVIRIKNGQVSDITINEHPKLVEELDW